MSDGLRISFFGLCFCLSLCARAQQPNVLILLADDLGYSDLGCYGSEISTPNLDALAEEGFRFPHFYNSARCCPSRAALLTGRHPHEAGMGGMVHIPKPGRPSPEGPYQGYLRPDLPTMAEIFKQAGYTTLMVGKWHVGEAREHWPLQRGFDRYFGLISGASSYYEVLPKRLMLNQNDSFSPPETFYATNAYADSACGFIRKAVAGKKPFLCYTAFTAPHWPLHAPEAVVAKYRKQCLNGWDSLRRARFERQKALGLVAKTAQLPLLEDIPRWDTLQNKEKEAEKMAVYSAMVDLMDQGIGRILNELKRLGQYDNTVILFLSDNGGCAETLDYRINQDVPEPERSKKLPPGPRGSYVAYGKAWASLSNTPFRNHKATIFEGGVASPFLLKPARPKTTLFMTALVEPHFITDILPGLLLDARIPYPKTWLRKALAPLPGVAPLAKRATSPYCWEHEGRRGVRYGRWKLVALKDRPWSLYDLEQDAFETQDLSETHSGKAKELETAWQVWSSEVGARP